MISQSSTKSNSTTDTTPEQVIADIAGGKYRVQVERLRSLTGEAADEAKRRLPAVMWSGRFSKRCNAALLEHSGLLCADVDKIGVTEAGELRQAMQDDPHVVAAFISPSGTGLKVVFKVSANASQHSASFALVRRYAKACYGLAIDEACKDVARLCYVGWDPGAFIKDAEELTAARVAEVEGGTTQPELAPAEVAEKVGDAPQVSIILTAPDEIGQIVASGAAKGYRNTEAFNLARRLRDAGTLEAIAKVMVQQFGRNCNPALPKGECDQATASAYKGSTSQPPVARPLGELEAHADNDPGELLRHRYLCRSGGMLIAGPTGIGKSSFVMQAVILWALGREMFGIAPTKPIKSLIIQAENDDGDLAEQRDGVIEGLGLNDEEREAALALIVVCREDVRTSSDFFNAVVRPLLAQHKPDLLIIDPALAYLGGETGSQADVGKFLRNGLNPLLREFNCGGGVIHHTNKPATGREKSTWQAGDFAYLGSGSAEWANWARAVLAIRSVGSHHVYELNAAKRGARLQWEDANGDRAYTKMIAHSKAPGTICWVEAEEDDLPDQGGRKAQYTKEMVSILLREKELTTTEWEVVAKKEEGMSRPTFHRLRRDARTAGQVKQQPSGKWISLL